MVSATTLLVSSVVLAAATTPMSAAQLRGSTNDTIESPPFLDSGGNYCYYNKNFDHVGFDVGNKPAKDYHDCNQICIDTSACVTWSWNNYNGGTCWLKKYFGRTVPSAGTVSLGCNVPINKPKEPNYVCGEYRDIDFVGNDIGSKKAFYSDCCEICDQTKGCKAYSWTNYESGTCWLKSDIGEVVVKPGAVSATTTPFFGTVCPFEYDTDYVGMDFFNVPGKNAGECCSTCRQSSQCKAYSWSNYNGGTCWLKSGKGKAVKAPGVVSAVLVMHP